MGRVLKIYYQSIYASVMYISQELLCFLLLMGCAPGWSFPSRDTTEDHMFNELWGSGQSKKQVQRKAEKDSYVRCVKNFAPLVASDGGDDSNVKNNDDNTQIKGKRNNNVKRLSCNNYAMREVKRVYCPENRQRTLALAQHAANEATAASDVQVRAGQEAAEKTRLRLADKACQANRSAQAALVGKRVIVDALEGQIKDAEGVLIEEAKTLTTLKKTAEMSCQVAKVADLQMKLITAAHQKAKTYAELCEAISKAMATLKREKEALMEWAKKQVEQLSLMVKDAHLELDETFASAQRAAQAAQKARNFVSGCSSCRPTEPGSNNVPTFRKQEKDVGRVAEHKPLVASQYISSVPNQVIQNPKIKWSTEVSSDSAPPCATGSDKKCSFASKSFSKFKYNINKVKNNRAPNSYSAGIGGMTSDFKDNTDAIARFTSAKSDSTSVFKDSALGNVKISSPIDEWDSGRNVNPLSSSCNTCRGSGAGVSSGINLQGIDNPVNFASASDGTITSFEDSVSATDRLSSNCQGAVSGKKAFLPPNNCAPSNDGEYKSGLGSDFISSEADVAIISNSSFMDGDTKTNCASTSGGTGSGRKANVVYRSYPLSDGNDVSGNADNGFRGSDGMPSFVSKSCSLSSGDETSSIKDSSDSAAKSTLAIGDVFRNSASILDPISHFPVSGGKDSGFKSNEGNDANVASTDWDWTGGIKENFDITNCSDNGDKHCVVSTVDDTKSGGAAASVSPAPITKESSGIFPHDPTLASENRAAGCSAGNIMTNANISAVGTVCCNKVYGGGYSGEETGRFKPTSGATTQVSASKSNPATGCPTKLAPLNNTPASEYDIYSLIGKCVPNCNTPPSGGGVKDFKANGGGAAGFIVANGGADSCNKPRFSLKSYAPPITHASNGSASLAAASSRYKCHFGRCGDKAIGANSPAARQKSTVLAHNAADEAEAAFSAQQLAGEEAARLVNIQLADKACQASNSAQAALSGKRAIVDHLEKQLEAAEVVLDEEGTNLHLVQIIVELSKEESVKAVQHAQKVTAALAIAQTSAARMAEVSRNMNQLQRQKENLIIVSHRQLDTLHCRHDEAVQDLIATCQAAQRAAAAAEQARRNTLPDRKRHAEGRHSDKHAT